MLLKALKSPDLRVMWRSTVEAFTQHRYITEPRTCGLVDGDDLLPSLEGGTVPGSKWGCDPYKWHLEVSDRGGHNPIYNW